jgi:DNA-binding transcriptional LysR family regulator
MDAAIVESMELRHLRYFVAVAEELSFTRAAGRLLMTQPSLSTQMKQLETELGVELFDRSRRSIRLTEAGRVLLDESRQVLAQLDRTVKVVRRVGNGEVGHLSVGFVPSASNRTLPPVLRAFRRGYPDVELFFQEMPPDELRRQLHERRIDIGFLFLPFDDDFLDTRTLAVEPLVAAVPSGHRLASAPHVTVADLAEEPFILPRSYAIPGYKARVMLACEQAGFVPRVVQKDVWLMQTVTGLVAADIGVALVPASEENVHREGVVYVELDGPVPTVEIGAAWRRDERTPVLDAMLAAVDEVELRPDSGATADALVS